MHLITLASLAESWTEILAYFDYVKNEYKTIRVSLITEVYYRVEEGNYRIVIKVIV